ncbi:MAG: methyl-accepting chemotaxis protein [Oscillospiraceae bacterium]|nr:methyl-accepting chemotaxis protein [Oscillospiraceae bacterium]
MKNLKVGRKLLVSFLIVIVMMLAVGMIGIIGMGQIDAGSDHIYGEQVIPLVALGRAQEHFQRMRVQIRNIAINSGDDAAVENFYAMFTDRRERYESRYDEFMPFLVSPEGIRMGGEIGQLYRDVFIPGMYQVIEGARRGESTSYLMDIMAGTTLAADQISENIENIMNIRIAAAASENESNTALYNMLLILIIAVLAVAVAIAIFFALYISGLISKPLIVLTTFMKRAAETGDIVVREADKVTIEKYSQSKDEIGQCISATALFMHEINEEMDLLEKIGDGDLTISPNVMSDEDKVGKALNKVVNSLNSMFSEINNASGQVSAGSKQISDGAQSLAQGSTEQAASVQQLSASISDIAAKTKTNAEMAGRAASLASNIKTSAEKGSGQMDEMMAAVKDINESSQNISKVIKSIDDIAFQTNILALNAAVEAARAGQHGKGFAVVAEEVRNLAAKSAEAAKDTESLIADSISKAELGSRIADDTAASLKEIVSGIDESTKLVGSIAQSSEEQSVGIDQVNSGVDQVAQVVQQNSATAEESAAASQEMSGQSLMLEELISRFKLKDLGGSFSLPASQSAPPAPANLPASAPAVDLSDDFGKY